jgi:hypothetical protein
MHAGALSSRGAHGVEPRHARKKHALGERLWHREVDSTAGEDGRCP